MTLTPIPKIIITRPCHDECWTVFNGDDDSDYSGSTVAPIDTGSAGATSTPLLLSRPTRPGYGSIQLTRSVTPDSSETEPSHSRARKRYTAIEFYTNVLLFTATLMLIWLSVGLLVLLCFAVAHAEKDILRYFLRFYGYAAATFTIVFFLTLCAGSLDRLRFRENLWRAFAFTQRFVAILAIMVVCVSAPTLFRFGHKKDHFML
jgi:hypothetical protein